MTEKIDHPPHYGGGDNPYEAIKVIEAWGLENFLWSQVYNSLKKARWHLDREIANREKRS